MLKINKQQYVIVPSQWALFNQHLILALHRKTVRESLLQRPVEEERVYVIVQYERKYVL